MFDVPLWSVLCAGVIVTLAMKCAAKTRAALVLAGDWVVCTALADLTGSQYLWFAMIGIDFAAALILLRPPVTRWQSLIGLTYVAEIIAHSAFGLVGENDVSRYSYWYTLHYCAWLQAALLFAWAGYDGGHKIYSDRMRHHRGLPSISEMLIRMGRRP